MEDNEIVALYWARSDNAIPETEKQYGRYCAKIAQNILGSREDSEECVNDTWLRAWNAMPEARPARLGAFLGKITRNLALNRWEQSRAEKRGGGEVPLALDELRACVPDGVSRDQIADDLALTDALNRFLAGLPAEKRRIFLRRYWYFSPVAEIAAEFGVSESKVKMLLLRTRKALRQFLEQEGIDL